MKQDISYKAKIEGQILKFEVAEVTSFDQILMMIREISGIYLERRLVVRLSGSKLVQPRVTSGISLPGRLSIRKSRIFNPGVKESPSRGQSHSLPTIFFGVNYRLSP